MDVVDGLVIVQISSWVVLIISLFIPFKIKDPILKLLGKHVMHLVLLTSYMTSNFQQKREDETHCEKNRTERSFLLALTVHNFFDLFLVLSRTFNLINDGVSLVFPQLPGLFLAPHFDLFW